MPLEIYKRGKIWHYRGTVAGQRLRGSCKTADKIIAQRIAAETESRAWKSHLDGPGAALSFAQAAGLYREAQKPTRYLAAIEDHWRDTPVREISAGAIRQHAIKLYPNASGATRNRHVIVPTAAIINHAADAELCARIRVKRFPVTTKTKKPATLAWVDAFCAHASARQAALCLFMFSTGARISEALSVAWRDVDLSAATALIVQTKIGDERLANLPPRVIAAFANIPSNRNPDDLVFGYGDRNNCAKVWANVIKRAGIERLTFHSCRHGFATTMLHRGVDVVTVAKMGGWKNVQQVIKTYGHAMTDPTITNRIFDTQETQAKTSRKASIGKERKKA